MTTRLQLYNAALRLCESRSIASLTVAEESRRTLDEIWADGGVHWCLEQGQWKFAMRSSQLDYDPSVAPEWGYQRAFIKPTDWCATSAVCSDEFYNSPLSQYADEIGFWFCDQDILYVRFVSDDAAYGGDLSRWPQTFADFAAAHFAKLAAPRLPGGKEVQDKVDKAEIRNLRVAKNKDAMAGPTTYPARGSWLRARFGRGSVNRRDGGNRSGPLIG